MTVSTFLIELAYLTSFTGVTTEAIKRLTNKEFKCPNLIAAAVAVVSSLLYCMANSIVRDISLTDEYVCYILGLTIMTWLSSMVGYDKVKQLILQIKGE